jgi:endoglucanase
VTAPGEEDSTPSDTAEPSDDTAPAHDTSDTAPADSGDAPQTELSPLAGLRLYVDPDSRAAQQAESWQRSRPEDAAAITRIAEQPTAMWLGAWSGDVESTVRRRQEAAAAQDAHASYVVYNIPDRDCGGYSSGGVDAGAYRSWVAAIARGLASRPSIVILEPDALTLTSCLDAAGWSERVSLLDEAAAVLSQAGASVYVDAGHAAWLSPTEAVDRLLALDVTRYAGFALNVSNFRGDEESLAWAEEVRASMGGLRYVLDTSRNGLGPSGSEWCNPPGRALGLPPDVTPDEPGLDARLWVKAPGESDGSCNGGPSAGTWWPEYALGLAQRAPWATSAAAR